MRLGEEVELLDLPRADPVDNFWRFWFHHLCWSVRALSVSFNPLMTTLKSHSNGPLIEDLDNTWGLGPHPRTILTVRPTFYWDLFCWRRVGLESAEELYRRRVTRILVEEFPMYFAVVTRVHRDSEVLGEVGGVISSALEPRVEAVIPSGAFKKNVRLSLQVK